MNILKFEIKEWFRWEFSNQFEDGFSIKKWFSFGPLFEKKKKKKKKKMETKQTKLIHQKAINLTEEIYYLAPVYLNHSNPFKDYSDDHDEIVIKLF